MNGHRRMYGMKKQHAIRKSIREWTFLPVLSRASLVFTDRCLDRGSFWAASNSRCRREGKRKAAMTANPRRFLVSLFVTVDPLVELRENRVSLCSSKCVHNVMISGYIADIPLTIEGKRP
jgi:hypothetical protein